MFARGTAGSAPGAWLVASGPAPPHGDLPEHLGNLAMFSWKGQWVLWLWLHRAVEWFWPPQL